MQAALEQTSTALPLTEARPRAARRAVTILFFLNGALFATWASRVPAIQAEHGLSHGALGLALFSIALGAVIAIPLAGILIVRFGSAPVSKAAALGYCAVLPVIVLAPNVATFALALVSFGVSHAALDVAMNAQAFAIEKQYGEPIMSSFHAMWSVGGLVGASVGGLLASHEFKPLPHFGLVAAIFGVGMPLIFPRLMHTTEHPTSEQKPRAILLVPSRRLLALGIVASCVMSGEGAMADWSAVYLRDSAQAPEGLAAAGYAIFSIAMASARFLGDYLTARFGPANMVRTGGGLAAAGMLLALFSNHAGIALAGFALVGAGFAGIVPIVFSAAGSARGFAPGIALASVSSLGYLGFLIGPPVIGLAAEHFGLRIALGVTVASSLSVVMLAPSVLPKHTNYALEQSAESADPARVICTVSFKSRR